jgi:hypothetical protein
MRANTRPLLLVTLAGCALLTYLVAPGDISRAQVEIARAAAPTGAPAQADDKLDYNAIKAAGREMANQLDIFQQLIATNSTLEAINGLSSETSAVQQALADFKLLVSGKASREKIYLGYFAVERKVNTVLDVISQIKAGHPSIQFAARSLQTASHDLQFAVMGSDGAAKPNADTIYRQTLNAIACNENLQMSVGWLYYARAPLKDWTADLKRVREALNEFKRLQDNKADAKAIRAQFAAVEKTWEKVVSRYKDTVPQERILLANRLAQEDRTYGRLATLLGVKDRRVPLQDVWGE